MNKRKRGFFFHPFVIRLLHWEFWSFGMVYFWLYPVWFYYCLKARSLFYFNASNPAIKNGGFLAESKKDIHAIAPEMLMPPTCFFPAFSTFAEVKQALLQAGFEYPLIGKPDIGGRGRGVKKLQHDADLEHYVQTVPFDFHIQQFIDLPREAGIFYYRMPGEPHGHITGIVEKEFLTVMGNGHDTIGELLLQDKRYVLQFPVLRAQLGQRIHEIPEEGSSQILVPYGNHARGAKFIDRSDDIDEALTRTIDEACRQIDQFYFGRLDIRYKNWELLRQGKDFCIIEINGAGSEPTHIYDPKHSIFFAWREIIRHWELLYRVSTINHQRGHRYLSFSEGVQMFREDREQSRQLNRLSELL